MYKLFSITEDGSVLEGIEVAPFTLKRVNVTAPVLRVGDSGGPLGVLPVKLTPELQVEFDGKGTARVLFGEIIQTPVAKVLQAGTEADNDEKAIVSFHGRGITTYSGDIQPSDTPAPNPRYLPFPGEEIRRGNSGGNDVLDMIFLVAKEAVFRFGKGGRHYDPNELFYRWDGKVLLGLTREERSLTAYF